MNTKTKQIIACAAAAVVAAVVGAALALGQGEGASASTGAATTTVQAPQTGFDAFRRCLEQNGVAIAPGERPNVDDGTLRQAFAACRDLLPARPHGDDDGFDGQDGPST